jgi:hypothetical protein
LAAAEKFPRFFLIAFKKNRAKQPREREKRKKTEEKNPTFFVMSPDGLFFCKEVFFVFLNAPFYETPKKTIKTEKRFFISPAPAPRDWPRLLVRSS